jgi:phage shock protein E
MFLGGNVKNILTGLVVLILGIGALVLLSNSAPVTSQEQPVSKVPKYEAIQKNLTNGGLLLDVRASEEYNAGHIKEAVLFPLTDIQKGSYPAVSKDTVIYLYCRTGNRSAQAKTILQQQGYTAITDLGSIQEVIALGAEIIK